jgi:transposase-like protein/5-methylcytosine-specific restriction endonuclease McrA
MDRAWLAERLGAGASYEAIARELGCSASKVSYWAGKHGLASRHTTRHAAREPLDEERLRQLIAAGLSVRAIARTMDRSPTTIRHWLGRVGLRTRSTVRIAEGAAAHAVGATEPILTCPTHGPTRHVGRTGGYRCGRCRAAHVAERRRRVKRQLVAEAGGACALCGYDRYPGALQFHHLDPDTKRFAISAEGVTRSLETARAEAQKCVLLCANCHAEVERGVADVPVRSDGPDPSVAVEPDPG